MYILGLTTLGDSAASLIKDGRIVAAAEEERFSRRKHHSGFPYHAVQYCLDEAGIKMSDVEHVALYWKPWVLRHKALQAVKSAFISRDMFKARVDRGVAQVGDSYLGMLRHPKRLRERFGPSDFKFHFLEHHQTHAASAFFVSPFERAAILTMDGTGEDTTTLFSVGEGTRIKPIKRIKLPHSLGQFYSAVTNFLGFDMFAGDEWKVMGLAAYGEPEFYDFFARRVLTTNGDHDFHLNVRVLDHHLAKHYQFSEEIVRALGEPRKSGEEIGERHQNIAASAQRVLEDTVLHLLGGLYERTKLEDLALAGGCAFNSVMNGRIWTETPFKRFFVQPAAGDAGCSLGAALLVYHQKLGRPRDFVMDHAYYGPSFTNDECRAALDAAGLKYETLPDEELLPRVARIIADGGIIGWFQGRMEFGPRALGGRSILGDPRSPSMQKTLNLRVKYRESFRPFAPAVLAEDVAEWFEHDRPSPYMLIVADVVQRRRRAMTADEEALFGIDKLNVARSDIPAVTHVDYSARLQTVHADTNPRFHALLSRFKALTGCPVLVNTSFNVRGEPIVCTPEDAFRCFMGSDLDLLVVENCLLR
ncbi:MAG TPA: carbamoyltransferase, partial [Pyrinomonadaceae bacterium]|nr:carbamoyltransferase [Pyrinomonadaceae bacterium]